MNIVFYPDEASCSHHPGLHEVVTRQEHLPSRSQPLRSVHTSRLLLSLKPFVCVAIVKVLGLMVSFSKVAPP
jgi:hypothetical protein